MESTKSKDPKNSLPALDGSYRCSTHDTLMIVEIQQALTEADNGDFATSDEVSAVATKWIKNLR